ncbi:hydroxyacid dehydrogenase [Mycobacterium sp. 852002-51057_SCH5723018]|nr:hydroxyacid dehydrogenase [Mycobacterium sp. 852002-51057_SCH5723018]
MPFRVVITHRVHPEVLDLLGRSCEVIANQTPDSLTRSELLTRCRDADALLVFMPDRVDEELLRHSPRLSIVAGALKGYDNIDVAACTARGVWVSYVEDLLTAPTADLAVGLLIALDRRVLAGDTCVRSGRHRGWRPELYGGGLAGKQVGIIGMGALGRAVARRLLAFDAKLLYTDPDSLPVAAEQELGVRSVPLEILLECCTAVVLTAPLTAQTRHLIGPDALRRLPDGALLVNVGRGSVVDENAVADALAAGRLGGYAADVFAFEDRSDRSRPREIPAGLLTSDRTLFTPHLGSAVSDVRRQIESAAAQCILDVRAGKPPAVAANAIVRKSPLA